MKKIVSILLSILILASCGSPAEDNIPTSSITPEISTSSQETTPIVEEKPVAANFGITIDTFTTKMGEMLTEKQIENIFIQEPEKTTGVSATSGEHNTLTYYIGERSSVTIYEDTSNQMLQYVFYYIDKTEVSEDKIKDMIACIDSNVEYFEQDGANKVKEELGYLKSDKLQFTSSFGVCKYDYMIDDTLIMLKIHPTK